MPDFTPEILNDVLTACNAGAGEAAGALSRTLDATISIAVGDSTTLKPDAMPAELGGPGLAILFLVGSSGAVLVLPESSSLVPSWCAAPDPTGQSKLDTLAQELGMNLLPEAFMPEDFKAARLENLADALLRAELAEGAAAVSLNLTTGDKSGIAQLIWPLGKPLAMLETPVAAEPETKPIVAAPVQAAPRPPMQVVRPEPPAPKALPNYTKSLLKIKVPVVVTLAEKKQSLAQIVEIGPGAIIQFEKSCEESLELEVGDRKIAAGEAIKVGDKFGLRITSIILPEERFLPVKPKKRLG